MNGKHHFSVSISQNIEVVPITYWISKLHKSATGARFIISSKFYVISSLSKNITTDFKLLHISAQKYHNKSKFFSEVKSF